MADILNGRAGPMTKKSRFLVVHRAPWSFTDWSFRASFHLLFKQQEIDLNKNPQQKKVGKLEYFQNQQLEYF